MIAYRTVIAATFPEVVLDSDGNQVYVNGEPKYQNKIKYLPIDYQEDRNVTANSQIVKQPLQNGDTMSDHMYRDPVTVSIKGKFALNGRNWNNDSYSFISNTGDRLTSIQWVFEYLKNSGTLCTLTTIATEIDNADYFRYEDGANKESILFSNSTPSKTRFLTRDNMALTSISWTEKQNVLEFNFNFQEVIMVDTFMYETDSEDLDLPSLTEPRAQSIGTILFNSGDLPKAIIQNLYDNGYIENDFLRWCSTALEDTGTVLIAIVAVAVGVGVIAATVASIAVGGTAFAALTGGAAALFPVGTIIAGAALVIGAIFGGIFAIIERHKKEEKQKKAFKTIKTDGKEDGTESYNRLCNLIDDVEASVNASGANIKVYNFNSDDEQSICLPIGGNYYYINLTKVNDYPYWKADIKINSNTEDGTPITNRRTQWAPVTNFNELNENINMWFKDENKQYEVYLVNPSLADEVNKTDEEKKVLWQKLSSYSIWVSQGHIKQHIEKINSAIEEAILEHDYI